MLTPAFFTLKTRYACYSTATEYIFSARLIQDWTMAVRKKWSSVASELTPENCLGALSVRKFYGGMSDVG